MSYDMTIDTFRGRPRGGRGHDHHHHHQHHHEGGRRGGGLWGRGFGGRKLSAGELQLLILALLEQGPAHGYEIIRSFEERSGGFYVPSPGMVYPALAYLDEIGLASAEADGNRKQYRLTETGAARLEQDRATATAMLDALQRIGARMEGVRDAFEGAEEVDPSLAELQNARRALKMAMISKRGCGLEEAKRISAILARATAEILQGSKTEDAQG
jgi:DNA-binding PadR family transcriptional regulator